MSEPKRYERCYHKDYIPEGMEEHYNGKWVKWEDYARLQAEVERLQSIHSIDSIGIEQLKAQVERLTKAGNALHAFLINYIVESRISSAYLNKLDDEWLAAKEVQS